MRLLKHNKHYMRISKRELLEKQQPNVVKHEIIMHVIIIKFVKSTLISSTNTKSWAQ